MIRSVCLLICLILAGSAMAGSTVSLGDTAPLRQDPTPHPLADLRSDPGTLPLEDALAALLAADGMLFGPLAEADAPVRSGPGDLPGAILRLLDALDHPLTADEHLGLMLMEPPGPATTAALVDLLDAYVLLHKETVHAFEVAEVTDAALEWSSVAVAQHRILAQTRTLEEAVRREGLQFQAAPLAFGPLAIDLSGGDDTYTRPYSLIIDLGGKDRYENNAGGNAANRQHCNSDTDPLPRTPTTGLLIDLSGDDQYASQRDCGVNGGGAYGSGMLVDVAGNDSYAGGGRGVNGGGYAFGLGLVVDAAGQDTYVATGAGVNGGGYAGGTGRLIDVRGNDAYTAGAGGTNGGATGAYHCVNMCQNAPVAAGILLDLGGTDDYWDLLVRGEDRTVLLKESTGFQIDLVLLV